MDRKLENLNLGDKTLSLDEFVLFSDFKSFSFPEMGSEKAKEIIEKAEKYSESEFPILRATEYMRFLDDGNRMGYQDPYYDRRKALRFYTLAECIERKGRFIKDLIDILWAISEETTWVVPAHNFSMKDKTAHANLPDCFDCDPWYIDLFSAETAACIAFAYYYLKEDIIKAGGELVCRRIEHEIDKRIVKPYLKYDEMWWMGFTMDWVNNWNPWINSNVLTTVALVVSDADTRKKIVDKCAKSIDNFIAAYKPDGGCDEGPSYWGEAGAAMFDCLEILYDMTGGAADLFNDPDLRNIVEYIYKVHINSNYFITYGDAHAKMKVNGALYRRIGRRFCSEVMEGFGQQMLETFGFETQELYNSYRVFKNIADDAPSDKKYVSPLFSVLPDMQLCAMRETNESDKGFYLWLKGGHNDESHNHNDIGSIGLYYNGEPVMIDIGIGEYTRFTFSDMRYTLFPIKSEDHNLPVIGGKGQKYGAEYKSDFFEADEKSGSVKIGYKGAYENREEIESLVRTASLKDGKVKICDEVKVKTPQDIVFNYYLKNKPSLLSDGVIDLGEGVKMEYSAGLKAEIEELIFEDKSLARDWECDRIYRVSFSTDGKVCEVVADFCVCHE